MTCSGHRSLFPFGVHLVYIYFSFSQRALVSGMLAGATKE